MPRCTLLIPSADRSRLLVIRAGARVALPTVSIETDWIAAEVGAIQAAVHETLGLEAMVLREISGEFQDRVAELEWIAGATTQPGAELVELSAVDELLANAEMRAIVKRWEAAIPEPDAPWTRQGWIGGARAWIDARLSERGATRVGPLRQIKGAWADSAVFAAASSTGDVYFKATDPHSVEPAVLAALSGRGRGGVPRILATDNTHKWMLMAAAGVPAQSIGFTDALRQFAALQRAEAPHAGEWLASGVPDRRPVAIRARLRRVLVEVPRQLHRGGLLSAAEAAALGDSLTRAEALCDRLVACGIPDSLAHDDFQPGNVLDAGGEFVFLDWSDVAVAHPFFSAHHFIAAAGPVSPVALRDAYLEPWIEGVGKDAAQEAFDASATLAPVYRAMFNDRMPDYEAWLATRPPEGQREFARGVFTTILEALSARR